MSTMPADSLSSALFTASQAAVLALLFGHPDERFYLRKIAQHTGLGLGHVQRELNRFAAAGILSRTRQDRHVYFQANPHCPIFHELRAIVRKTLGAPDLLRNALLPLHSRIRVAFIYGSVARGEENAQSDLDLMVVGDASFADLLKALRPVESQLQRTINPTVYPPDEFHDKVKSGNHFLNAVLKRELLFVLGDSNELPALLAKRLDPPSRNHRRGDSHSPRHRRS